MKTIIINEEYNNITPNGIIDIMISTHYYDYLIEASSKKESKEIVLDKDFCDDSHYDYIDWTSQKVDDVVEQNENM